MKKYKLSTGGADHSQGPKCLFRELYFAHPYIATMSVHLHTVFTNDYNLLLWNNKLSYELGNGVLIQIVVCHL
jgi:hypothetical protein